MSSIRLHLGENIQPTVSIWRKEMLLSIHIALTTEVKEQ